MISVDVHDPAGNKVGSYQFDPAALAPKVNRQLLHDVVVMYEANRRVGTVQTKSRGMVAGSTKKMFKQKGTGRARMGPKRTPIRRGGGHCFAKVPKDWSYRLPKKAVRLATRMALLSKFLDNEAVVLNDLPLSEAKTRVVAGVLKSLGLTGQSCLLAIATHDPVLWRSARNIADLCVSPAADLNAYQVLRQKRLVVTTSALDRILGRG